MWASSCPRLVLSSASHGLGFDDLARSRRRSPTGSFIHPFTAITQNEPVKPVITIGMPVRKCVRFGSRSQP